MVIFARFRIHLYGSILVYMWDKRRDAYICLHRSVYVHLSVYMPILAYKDGYMGI